MLLTSLLAASRPASGACTFNIPVLYYSIGNSRRRPNRRIVWSIGGKDDNIRCSNKVAGRRRIARYNQTTRDTHGRTFHTSDRTSRGGLAQGVAGDKPVCVSKRNESQWRCRAGVTALIVAIDASDKDLVIFLYVGSYALC